MDNRPLCYNQFMLNKVPGKFYRLIIILAFMTLTWPDHFRLIYYLVSDDKPQWIYLLFPLTFVLFITFELIEFFHFRYNQKKRVHSIILYALRLTPLLISFLIFEDEKFFPWFLELYLPLVIFYSYLFIPRKARIILLITVLLWIFTSDLSLFSHLSDPKRIYTMLDATYKAMAVLFFYFFAWFWEKDRIRSEERTVLLEELKEYAGKAAENAALEERTRLARDLHDSLGHAMTAIQIQLAKAEAYYGKEDKTSRDSLRTARETAKDAMEDIRDSLSGLNKRSELLDLRTSLPPLLHPLENTGCAVEFHLEGSQAGYNYSVLMTSYRMVQEGITNILKHAEASEASLRIVLDKEEMHIRLADKGRGFTYSDEESHYGLSGLKRRIELVRGILDIASAPEEGTVLSARIPRDPLSLMENS